MFLMRSVGVMPSALSQTRAENEKGLLAHLHRVGTTRRETIKDIMRSADLQQNWQSLSRERANVKFRAWQVGEDSRDAVTRSDTLFGSRVVAFETKQGNTATHK